MIAVKREVAVRQKHKSEQVFRGANVKLGNWRQVTVRITTVSRFCTQNSTAAGVEKARAPCMFLTTHTGECTVTACRTELQVRKGGDFFYGKSSNENHTESV